MEIAGQAPSMMRNPPRNGENTARSGPALRLVTGDVDLPLRPVRAVNSLSVADRAPAPSRAADESLKRRRMEVARENHAASSLDADDARWVFAVLVSKVLDGGRAAILAPERRALLMGNAKEIGLREFDANLVIAIVQDCVRTGHERLCPETQARLAMVREAHKPSSIKLWQFVAAGIVAGGAIAGMVIMWLRG